MAGLPRTPVSDLTVAELEAMTADLDDELVAEKFRPLSAAERADWGRIKRRPGRPRRGAGVKVISVSVEKELLAASDRLARRRKTTRANLIERGLRAVLAVEGMAVPPVSGNGAR